MHINLSLERSQIDQKRSVRHVSGQLHFRPLSIEHCVRAATHYSINQSNNQPKSEHMRGMLCGWKMIGRVDNQTIGHREHWQSASRRHCVVDNLEIN